MSALAGLSNQARERSVALAVFATGVLRVFVATLLVSWVRLSGRAAVVHQRPVA
jgi:hypothetical protein